MIRKIILSLLISNFLLSTNIYASPAPFTFSQPPAFSITDIGRFIAGAAQMLYLIAGLLIFIYIAWGGLEWLTSGGDAGKAQAARDRITAALMGMSILACLVALSYVIQFFFGIKIIGLNVTPKGY